MIALLLLAAALVVLAARQLLKRIVEGERRQRQLDRTGKMDPNGERRIIAGGSWHTEKVRRPQRPDPSNWR